MILKKMSEEQLRFVRRVLLSRIEERRDGERVKVTALLLQHNREAFCSQRHSLVPRPKTAALQRPLLDASPCAQTARQLWTQRQSVEAQ